jgi:uncharacterized protein (DUF302 family)
VIKSLRLLLLASLLLAGQAMADQMIMARVNMKADLAIEYLKTAIEEHGYAVAHTQKCDTGMADFGLHSDFYRVVFFGKLDEVRRISAEHPEFVAYLPLKIVVEAEKSETVMVAVNPLTFNRYYANAPDMLVQFQRWRNDILSILNDVHKAAGGAVALHGDGAAK